ncbi:hypothetical protein Hanom_Chr15g01394901 [Helianthus anomalus]
MPRHTLRVNSEANTQDTKLESKTYLVKRMYHVNHGQGVVAVGKVHRNSRNCIYYNMFFSNKFAFN